jgi:hypothetical protein
MIFHVDGFSQALAITDFVLLVLAVVFGVTVVPFLLFWGFIVAIIGAGVRLGTAGRNR